MAKGEKAIYAISLNEILGVISNPGVISKAHLFHKLHELYPDKTLLHIYVYTIIRTLCLDAGLFYDNASMFAHIDAKHDFEFDLLKKHLETNFHLKTLAFYQNSFANYRKKFTLSHIKLALQKIFANSKHKTEAEINQFIENNLSFFCQCFGKDRNQFSIIQQSLTQPPRHLTKSLTLREIFVALQHPEIYTIKALKEYLEDKYALDDLTSTKCRNILRTLCFDADLLYRHFEKKYNIELNLLQKNMHINNILILLSQSDWTLDCYTSEFTNLIIERELSRYFINQQFSITEITALKEAPHLVASFFGKIYTKSFDAEWELILDNCIKEIQKIHNPNLAPSLDEDMKKYIFGYYELTLSRRLVLAHLEKAPQANALQTEPCSTTANLMSTFNSKPSLDTQLQNLIDQPEPTDYMEKEEYRTLFAELLSTAVPAESEQLKRGADSMHEATDEDQMRSSKRICSGNSQ